MKKDLMRCLISHIVIVAIGLPMAAAIFSGCLWLMVFGIVWGWLSCAMVKRFCPSWVLEAWEYGKGY